MPSRSPHRPSTRGTFALMRPEIVGVVVVGDLAAILAEEAAFHPFDQAR